MSVRTSGWESIYDATWFIYKFYPTFSTLGEKLSDDEVAELFGDCMDPEDDEGNIFYARMYHKSISVHIPRK